MTLPDKVTVGILASESVRTDPSDPLGHFIKNYSDKLSLFRVIATGGTFCQIRSIIQDPSNQGLGLGQWLNPNAGGNLESKKPGMKGGVIELANEVVTGKCRVVIFFTDSRDKYAPFPENRALLRVCNVKGAKLLFNLHDATSWAKYEADADKNWEKWECEEMKKWQEKTHEWETRGKWPPNQQPRNIDHDPNSKGDYCPACRVRYAPETYAETLTKTPEREEKQPPKFCPIHTEEQLREWKAITTLPIGQQTIALIAHDKKKEDMFDFVMRKKSKLHAFHRIITTGTTGKGVEKFSQDLLKPKVMRYESGPLGGDVQIADEIVNNACHNVIFFMDPSTPHPHIEDIHLFMRACTLESVSVNLRTNVNSAEHWIDAISNRLPHASCVAYERSAVEG